LSLPNGIATKVDVAAEASSSGRLAAVLAASQEPPSELLNQLLPTFATLIVGIGGWGSFAFFGRRRRDDKVDPAEARQAAAAASGLEGAAAGGLQSVDESMLPRWRRPSLQQARRTDPLRAVAGTEHMSFETAGVSPLANYERRRIGYRVVRLLDSPDELRATEIGVVDQGDEVQLLDRYGAYWLVLCPDGRQGWLHRMTLADADADADADAAPPEPRYDYVEEPGYAQEPAYGNQAGYPEQLAYLDQAAYAEPAPPIAQEVYESAEAAEAPEAQGYDMFAEDPDGSGLLEAYMRARSAAEPAVEIASAVDVTQALEVESNASVEAEPVVEVEPLVATDEPVVAADAASTPSVEPAGEATPAAKPKRAGARYSAQKPAGTRKAATASRPGTKSRRPSA
jgi:hypothetical protein